MTKLYSLFARTTTDTEVKAVAKNQINTVNAVFPTSSFFLLKATNNVSLFI